MFMFKAIDYFQSNLSLSSSSSERMFEGHDLPVKGHAHCWVLLNWRRTCDTETETMLFTDTVPYFHLLILLLCFLIVNDDKLQSVFILNHLF